MNPKRSKKPLSRIVVGLSAVGVIAALAACAPYRIDIQQGNVVSAEQLAQVRAGMTREQVRFLLGTPLLTDPFHDGRWDYLFRLRDGATGEVRQRRLTIWFGKDGKLERYEADEAMKAVPPDVTGGARAYDLTPPPPPQEKKP